MNYLAHLFLADCDNKLFMLGSLLGDFTTAITGDMFEQFEECIVYGIMHHRKVDAFTDGHLEYQKAKKILFEKHRHFSGIILDVLFDFFLIKHWSSYSDISYDDFIDKAYEVMSIDNVSLPLSYVKSRNYLIAFDVLNEYQTLDGVDVTLNRLAGRFKRKTTLPMAINDIELNIDIFEECFLLFFPELLEKYKV